MKSLVLAVTLLSGLVGCSRGPEPTPTAPAASSSTQALVSPPSSLTLDRSQNAICPQQWTCDSFSWFSTQSACTSSTACAGQQCIRDFNCNGRCTCP